LIPIQVLYYIKVGMKEKEEEENVQNFSMRLSIPLIKKNYINYCCVFFKMIETQYQFDINLIHINIRRLIPHLTPNFITIIL